jgi:3-oxoadipate enol-lactonase
MDGMTEALHTPGHAGSVGSSPETVPDGRLVLLPGRGETFVRIGPARPGAPTVALLHGWLASADLNFFGAYQPLCARFNLVAIDHRGHGRGLRTERPFALEAVADDFADALGVLGVGPVIPVGYSMGGPIAQLAWHRHRDRIAGLVLCATAHRFQGREPMRGFGPALVTRSWAMATAPIRRARIDVDLRRWLLRELRSTDQRKAMQAGFSLARFDSSAWLGDVDVPHAVVLTTRDGAVLPPRQQRLADALPAPTVVRCESDHSGCVTRPDRFVPALVEALDSLTRA